MDLFAGLDGLGSSSSKKLSLAEQRKLQEDKNKSTVQAFETLDLLASSSSSSSFSKQEIPIQSSTVSITEDDDLFGIFNSAPPKAQPSTQPSTQPAVNTDRSNGIRESKPKRFENSNHADQNDDLLKWGSSSKKPTPSSSMASTSASSMHKSANRGTISKPSGVSDRGVAQLVEMGFEPDDANRALRAMNGNVRGAVNWLMAEAQGLPLPEPKSSSIGSSLGTGDFSDFQAAASQIGASMFSKASSLFAKGRKEIEKAYNQYNNQYSGDPNQPAWMKDKAKYDSRRNFNDEPELPRRPSRRAPAVTRDSVDSMVTPTNEQSAGERPVKDTRAQNSSPVVKNNEARPSRAELFRQKQRERNGSGLSSQENPTPIDSPMSPSGTGSVDSRIDLEARSAPMEEKLPEVDLLNLGGSTPASTSLTSTQTDIYTTSRSLGSEAFRKGDYEGSVEHYTAALQVVPESSALRALLLSNRSAALLKAGNLRGAFDDTAAGIQLLPNKGHGVDLGEDVSMPDIWVKLVTRNAQAAEHMEKFDAALKSWQLLLDNGHASPTVLDAKRRCLKALNPEAVKKASVSTSEATTKKSQRRGWGTTGAMPTSDAGKAALEKVKANHNKQAEEERQKDLLRDKVSARVARWRDGNENNLRVLLSTLQNVLWDSCEWTPVNMTDLVVPKKVRLVYMKAVARTHPDKVPNTAPVEVRMISQSVFVVIQHAWDQFRQENGL